uniref:Immunoglobulin V-set domain-containing protein n=1 Tax=Oryzias sinensis TaxID=183150 RepID=A0A8C7WT54_9TELE
MKLDFFSPKFLHILSCRLYYLLLIKLSLLKNFLILSICYGALGGTVSLQLMDDFSQIHKYDLKFKTDSVLSGGKNGLTGNKMKDRSSFFPYNGTFWIHNLSRNDSGEYKLTTFDSNGKMAELHTLHLLVQGKCFY